MRLATENHGAGLTNLGASHDTQSSPTPTKSIHENQHSKPTNHSSSREEHSAVIARATNDAVRDWDVRSGALSWPQGLETLLGYSSGHGVDTIAFWQKQLHPDDRVRTAASIRDALTTGAERWSGEYRFRCADESYVLLLERACIVRDATGEATRFVGSLMDISARKQLHDQFCRSQKMEAFGQLAGGVAHDFNNYLTTILGYSDLLLNELGVKHAIANHIAEIRKAAGRASSLTGQLLAFSRRHPLAPRVVEVNALITNLERSLLGLLGENIAVECHLDRTKEGVHIQVDTGEITQVILNLAVNARDAMPDGGRLVVETNLLTVVHDEDVDVAFAGLDPGEYASISLTDTGVGMTAEVKAHLFEPFFTTKAETHASSGLGLATSYGIVRQSGGGIGFESLENKGATFRIYLPRVPAPPPPPYKKPRAKKLPVGTETILVLEDEISVRHISVRVLRNLGYDVIEAANTDDAKRLMAERGDGKIHLLLTDMMLPQMSGRRFAGWLRQVSPHTKIIFVSGYLEESLRHSGLRDDEMFFLPKPFDPEQLAIKVREALDS
ncbi:MAG: PAS domain-containing protein [Chthoniobacterales bacterium]